MRVLLIQASWRRAHLSALMPPSTVSHDCPNTVFGEFCTATLLVRQCSDFMEGGFHCSELRFRRSLGEGDPTLPYHTCEALTCFHWRPLAPTALCLDLTALLGPWVKSCAVDLRGRGTKQRTETRGTLTCAYDEVAGDVGSGGLRYQSACRSFVRLMDPSTGVTHECHDILSQGSCVALRPVEYEADGKYFQQLPCVCCSSDEFCQRGTNCVSVMSADARLSHFDTERRWREFDLRRRPQSATGAWCFALRVPGQISFHSQKRDKDLCRKR